MDEDSGLGGGSPSPQPTLSTQQRRPAATNLDRAPVCELHKGSRRKRSPHWVVAAQRCSEWLRSAQGGFRPHLFPLLDAFVHNNKLVPPVGPASILENAILTHISTPTRSSKDKEQLCSLGPANCSTLRCPRKMLRVEFRV
jgi:hypothetical protein